jgi:hypothetical protein
MLIFRPLFWNTRTLSTQQKAKFAAEETSPPINARRHCFIMTRTGLLDDFVYCTSEGEEVETPEEAEDERSHVRSPMACTPLFTFVSRSAGRQWWPRSGRWPGVCSNATWPQVQTCMDRIRTVGSAKHRARNHLAIAHDAESCRHANRRTTLNRSLEPCGIQCARAHF